MKKVKRVLALLLSVCMLTGMTVNAAAVSDQSNQTSVTAADSDFDKVLHLDNGRKYFTKEWIVALINEMSAAGYNQLQLAFGNDGMRFLLDDMSVTVDETTYSSEDVTAGIKQGNKNYYDAGTANELTQAEMTEIVNYAKSKGIEIVPHMNMPGHMDAILDAMEYVGISDAHFTGSTTSVRSLNLNNDAAVEFTHALLEKYVAYFKNMGCEYFHIGADEFGNDAYNGNMGFPNMGSELYAKFADFVNEAAAIVKNAGMTPRAWNDGISYTRYSSVFDTAIQITYWSSGWGGYDVASASSLRKNGHEMINTNGDYYFILTSDGITNPSGRALEFNNNAFMGSTISDPVGSMFCIWCDDPGSATEQEVAEAVRITLRKMAASMNDTEEYSEEVVSGGFNANGTIAESRNWNEVSSGDNNAITVSGYDLTHVETIEVETENVSAIEKAGNKKAWDITPYVGDSKYTEKGMVSLPVPDGWNTERLKGFYVEGEHAILVDGTYAEGHYTFEMPHFSVAGIAEIEYDELIELNVGESQTVIDSTGNYKPSYTGAGLNSDIATVEVEGSNAVTGTTVSTSKTTELENGATYVVRVYDTAYALSSDTGRGDWGTKTLAFQNNALTANTKHFWTVEATGSGYKLKNAAGYLNLGGDNNSAYLNSTGEVFTITNTSTGWTVGNQYGRYINALGGLTTYYSAGGWTVDSTRFDFYKVTEATEASTNITFSGVTPGTTSVTVGSMVYKIVVSKSTVTDTVTVAAYKTYADGSSNVIVADSSIATATLENGILTITGVGEGTTTITTDNTVYNITVTAFDLNTVDPLTIEYWITNGVVTDPDTGLTYVEISASRDGIYSAEGVALADIVPVTLKRENRDTEYWQGKLLDVTKTNNSTSGTQEQTRYVGDDETLVDTTFTRIRYWNGEWQVLVGTEWSVVDRTEVTVNTYDNQNMTGTATRETHQLVAYYMEVIDIKNANGTTELYVNAADWGFKSGENWGYGTSTYDPCTVTVQIVYEDGTTNPSDELDNLLTKTLVYGYWSGGRGLGTMIFDGGDNYDIYKVTAETGAAAYTNNNYGFTIDNLTWDENEETVWADAPTRSVSIGNPARNPSYEEPKDNLVWNTGAYNENNAILVRVYVKAVETEDTLNVVYYDEKFGDTLYEYNINVTNGVNFNNSILNLSTGNIQNPGIFSGNDSRIDVTGYGIKNALDVTQKFQTDLTLVPEAVGKYNNDLYKYTGSVISEDGKTLYLYYNIDTTVLSPMFVVDYGNPFTFELSQVVNDVDLVKEVSVNGNTRYGTLEYDTTSKEFTYTPTQVLQNIDVLTINIKFDGDTTFTTSNAGVMPATTVDYEEGFATLNGFTGGSQGASMQVAQVAGKSSDEYGYDSNIVTVKNTKAVSNAKGSTTTFAFTGTGVDLYINSTKDSGNIAVQVRDASNRLVKVISVKTTSHSTITENFSNTEQKGLIAASVTGLAYGQYTVKVTTTNDVAVYFDGFRVYGTIQNLENDYYKNDLEDNPLFLELRDYVLTSMNVTNSDSKAVYAQIREATDGVLSSAILSATDLNGRIKYSGQDLLDNGPKNELFLLPGQSVVFKLTTAREVQVGMKAVNGPALVKGTYGDDEGIEISSERDMFYTVINKNNGAVAEEKTVTITNDSTSNSILSITKVKICDDPNATFGELEEEDLVTALETLGYKSEDAEPETPATPEVPSEPEPVYADASLDISLADRNGAVLATTSLTANGMVGENVVFSATVIEESVASILPEGYELKDASYTDTEVAYGKKATINFVAEKIIDEEIDVVEIIVKNVFNAVNNLFKKLFSWW